MSSPLKFETLEEALVFFDSLDPITPSELIGLWKGSSLPTGHPLDGALESLGWYGKRFHADRRADALLFSTGGRRLVPLDPKHLPLRLVLRFSGLAHRQWFRNLFGYAMKGMWARGPVAAVKSAEFRAASSAAMIYDNQPIMDHFRRIDADRVMGLMVVEGQSDHYVFLLERAEEIAVPQIRPRIS